MTTFFNLNKLFTGIKLLATITCCLFVGPTILESQSPKPLIVATTGIVADLLREVGGDRIEVRSLMGPGVDPHLYKATHGDLGLFSKAEVVFYNGLHLEGKMQDVLIALKKRKRVYAVADALAESTLRSPPEFSGQYDPHIWFDVGLWSKTVPYVAKALIELLPLEQDYFSKRAETYQKQLDELNIWVRIQSERIAPQQRVLITAHDAFGYFGAAYGYEVLGLQGISTASEFGLADIERITRVIIERKIGAIFVETSVPERFIQSIQQGVQAKGSSVRIGGALYSDALGELGTEPGTYIGMVRHNVKTIVGAL